MIGFNPKFLIDALRVIDDEEVDLYFMNAKKHLALSKTRISLTFI